MDWLDFFQAGFDSLDLVFDFIICVYLIKIGKGVAVR